VLCGRGGELEPPLEVRVQAAAGKEES